MSALQDSMLRRRNLVLGLGATGLSVARFLKRQGEDAVFADTRAEPPGVEALGDAWPGKRVAAAATTLPANVDRIIASPGVPDSDPVLAEARARGIDVVSDIQLFVDVATAPFVGITGTNGKSTVTSLVAAMAEAAVVSALAGGNLGRPALDLLADEVPEWYVLELSSFQLQRTPRLPAAVAALLNISPDHLDWHGSEAAYREAKYHIFDDADAAVFNRADDVARRRAMAAGRAVSFGDDEPGPHEFGLREQDDRCWLARGDTLLIAADELAMVGRHNRLNALAALAIGTLMGLPMPAMLKTLRSFGGLAHRMQRIGRINDVDYVNDSKATNVAAAVAAIGSVPGSLVLIAGGDGKGADFAPLADALGERLRAAVLIGRDAKRMAAALGDGADIQFAADMGEAVTRASRVAQPGDTVLLAPACASIDQFDNYMARGDAFADAVGRLAA